MRDVVDRRLMTARPGMPGQRSAVRLTAMLDELAAQLGLRIKRTKNGLLVCRDGVPVETWREDYPYDRLLGRKRSEEAKRGPPLELLKLPRPVQPAGGPPVIVFRGRAPPREDGTHKRVARDLSHPA